MRKIMLLTLALATLFGVMGTTPARANDSKATVALSGSVAPAGTIWFRVTDRNGLSIRTVSAAYGAGDNDVIVRNGLVAPLANGVTLTASGASALEVTYAPGTRFRCWVSSNDTTYTEVVTGAPPTVRGVTFTDAASRTHAVSTPAMDVWGLLALVLALGAGGWFMLRKLSFDRVA